MLHGSILGCVRWSPKRAFLPPLYNSLIKLSNQHIKTDELLSTILQSAETILPKTSCWLPIYANINSHSKQNIINKKIDLNSFGISVICDTHGTSALLIDINNSQ
jgi:hypothetical protein